MTTKRSAPPAKTTRTEEIRVVLAADGLNDTELGALLRTEGIHSAQLQEWRKAAEAFAQRSTSKAQSASKA